MFASSTTRCSHDNHLLSATSTAWVQESLSITEVKRVLAQAIHEARTRGVGAAIAVSDRTGNILAVYNMIGANRQFNAAGIDCTVGLSNIPVGCVVVTSDPKQPNGVPGKGGLERLDVPGPVAAIAKAITGAIYHLAATRSQHAQLVKSFKNTSIQRSVFRLAALFLGCSLVNCHVLTWLLPKIAPLSQ